MTHQLWRGCSTLRRDLQDAETRKSFEDFKAQEAAKKNKQTCVPAYLLCCDVNCSTMPLLSMDGHVHCVLKARGSSSTLTLKLTQQELAALVLDLRAQAKLRIEGPALSRLMRSLLHDCNVQAVREAPGAAGVQRRAAATWRRARPPRPTCPRPPRSRTAPAGTTPPAERVAMATTRPPRSPRPQSPPLTALRVLFVLLLRIRRTHQRPCCAGAATFASPCTAGHVAPGDMRPAEAHVTATFIRQSHPRSMGDGSSVLTALRVLRRGDAAQRDGGEEDGAEPVRQVLLLQPHGQGVHPQRTCGLNNAALQIQVLLDRVRVRVLAHLQVALV